MPQRREGMPVWTDAMLPDLEAGKHFYGELFGWTFETTGPEYGDYTQALLAGKRVAGLAPTMPEQPAPPAWTLYFATPDVAATADRIREHGGEIHAGPMQVGPFGSMLVAREPSGAVFAAWQPGEHKGFEKQQEPGSFCWAELATRDVAAVDAFFPAVFPTIRAKRMATESMDYRVWEVDGDMVAGRYAMGADAPPDAPPHIEVYFAVDDCDHVAATAAKLGGEVAGEPQDSPYGRYARVVDQQGAGFAIIDQSRKVGEPPPVEG